MTEPYIIRSTGPGEANVVDRATGERVGWLRADFWRRWEAYVRHHPHPLGGPHRYRTDAARAAWRASR